MRQGPIALTGATGFVGQALLDLAGERGLAVRALARQPQASRAGVEWVAGSLSDPAALARLCDGAEAVIHVAGVVNAPDPAGFEAGNVVGTAAVLAAAGGRRFVHVSSLSAREPQLSAYGASKARAEALVRAAPLDWRMVRPPWIYGPRDRDTLELFRMARLGVVPAPRGRASVIHVADLARLLLAMAAPTSPGAQVIYEADDGQAGGWDHTEIARMIGAAVRGAGRKVWLPRLAPGLLHALARGDTMVRGRHARLTRDRASYMSHPDWVCSPAARVPAALWAPEVPTAGGLSATAQWYRAVGWL